MDFDYLTQEAEFLFRACEARGIDATFQVKLPNTIQATGITHGFLSLCGYSKNAKVVFVTADNVEESGPTNPIPEGGYQVMSVRVMQGAQIEWTANENFLAMFIEEDISYTFFQREALLSAASIVVWKVPIPKRANVTYKLMRNLLQAYLPDECQYILLDHRGTILDENLPVDPAEEIILVPVQIVNVIV